ncbi:opioid-binding protein/cell adhesion molecule homolog [Halyomorpha halys]|uniref:opioid-binding protein/cell adhesion molecule homolog n=1 Tax=Halyomorpha halys TaxID=286706 RepID=UPI0006D4FF34
MAGLSLLLLLVAIVATSAKGYMDGMPHFTTEGRHFKVVEHDSITLPCRVVNIGNHIRAWKRGIAVLTAGNVKVSPDDRYSLIHGYDLEIRSITPQDEGEYICQIATLQPQEITHTLEVLVPPRILEVSGGGLVEARKGTPVTIECRATGNPPPFFQWTRRVNTTMPGLKPMNGSTITMGAVNRHQAGVYQCQANNGVGRSAFRDVTLRVLYAPEVEADETWVHSGIGNQAILTCTVYAEPPAEVRWYRSALKLDVTDDHTTEKRGNRHRLIIRQVQLQDLDNYTCEALNNLGKSRQYIVLSGNPRVAIFRSNPLSKWRDCYNISWSVFSYTPLQEHRLFYRRKQFDGQLPNSLLTERWGANMTHWYQHEWTEIIIPVDVYNDDITQEKYYLITNLDPATQYEAKVKASNSFGWNQMSDIFTFSTRGLDGYSWESSHPAHEIILASDNEIRDLGVMSADSGTHHFITLEIISLFIVIVLFFI